MPNPTVAERRLIDAVAAGVVADFTIGDPSGDDPARDESWGDDRTISAAVARALATESNPAWPVTANGCRIAGARIAGVLDLAGARVRFPLAFIGCHFTDELSLRAATTDSLFFGGSALPACDARSLRASGDVQLSGGFRARGPIRLDDAAIAGHLSFNGASVEGSPPLSLDRATIGGHLLLGNGFKAIGVINARGIRVGGMLYCSHGRIENPAGVALAADGAVVAGDAVLSNGFVANGEVRLCRARLRRTLYCARGTFRSPGGDALSLDRAEINGRVYLGEWFSAKGAVSLAGARIGGDLHCVGGIFQNPGGKAIRARGANIAGSVHMHTRFLAQGAVGLEAATIGGGLYCNGGQFDNPGGVALAAGDARIGRNVVLGSGLRARGAVSFDRATIDGSLDLEDAALDDLSIAGAIIRRP